MDWKALRKTTNIKEKLLVVVGLTRDNTIKTLFVLFHFLFVLMKGLNVSPIPPKKLYYLKLFFVC